MILILCAKAARNNDYLGGNNIFQFWANSEIFLLWKWQCYVSVLKGEIKLPQLKSQHSRITELKEDSAPTANNQRSS